MDKAMKLTETERKALARYYLGGSDAWHTAGFKISRNTIDSLYRKGLLDKRGFTDAGRAIAKELADNGTI